MMTMTLVSFSIDSLVSLFKRDMATTKILANDILALCPPNERKNRVEKQKDVANETARSRDEDGEHWTNCICILKN